MLPIINDPLKINQCAEGCPIILDSFSLIIYSIYACVNIVNIHAAMNFINIREIGYLIQW